MKRDSVVAWSGPALTAKLFLPIILLVIVGIIAAPLDNAWADAWNLFAAAPIAGLAIWLFATIVELRPTEGGVRYRKWIRWNSIPLSEITDIVRVFPCFAAVIPNDGRRLYFFPDPDTSRGLRPLSDRGCMNVGGVDRRKQISWHMRILVITFGVVVGVLGRHLTHPLADHNAESQSPIVLGEQRYLPFFVGASLVYLIMSVAGQRLRGSELYISLALIGLGSAYVCEAFLSIFWSH
jgi:hypothetical protein